ncbi:MAG: transcriptional regulator [Deltaproteobacteria bacterium]|nr:MAG: transcriptional regulator [Deltaproteobacteria bacterium]
MLGLLLKEGELCVCNFTDVLGITQSKASRHLRQLVDAGFLDDRRDGTWVYFRIAEKPGPEQAQVIEMLPGVLEGKLPREIFGRLAAWRRKKQKSGDSCKRLPSRTGARTRRQR